MQPSATQPELTEDLVEDVLLCFPPDDPASLVRAALVSKRWCCLIAGRGFRRRFRELHGTPPMLGFICNIRETRQQDDNRLKARLVPTSSCLPHADLRGWEALDYRHCRVILYRYNFHEFTVCFCVWCPVTGEQLEVPDLLVPDYQRFPWPVGFNATILCDGGTSCDHLDCYHGPFLVILMFTCHEDGRLFISVYSSDAGAWSEPIPYQALHPVDFVCRVPAALLGNALYFVCVHRSTDTILKYDLGTRETSFIHLPHTCRRNSVLLTTEKGKLGFARLDGDFELYLWSMEVIGTQGDVAWTQDKVIELRNLLPAEALWMNLAGLSGCVHGRGVILVVTVEGIEDGYFTVDTNSNQAKKLPHVMKDDEQNNDYYVLVAPYTSFHFPALGAVSTAEEPSAGESSA